MVLGGLKKKKKNAFLGFCRKLLWTYKQIRLHVIKAERVQVNTLKKQQWPNLKGDYTSSQKQAQEPQVRGLKPFTTKTKNHPPKGKKNILKWWASRMERKNDNFFCSPTFTPCFLLMNCSFNTWTPLLAASLDKRAKDSFFLLLANIIFASWVSKKGPLFQIVSRALWAI